MSRILSVLLFLIFIMLSLFNIGYTTVKYIGVRQELSSSAGEQQTVRTQSTQFLAKISEMRAIKTRIVAYLEFTREELPAVEFMQALEDALPAGLKIANLDIRPDNALMVGASLTDNEIISFAENLAGMRYIVTTVDSPVTTKSVLGSRQIMDFRLSCNIRKILDIAADSPLRTQQIVPAVPAEQQAGGGGQ
jgi:hypothetical protein